MPIAMGLIVIEAGLSDLYLAKINVQLVSGITNMNDFKS
jgi:hypothetical protein